MQVMACGLLHLLCGCMPELLQMHTSQSLFLHCSQPEFRQKQTFTSRLRDRSSLGWCVRSGTKQFDSLRKLASLPPRVTVKGGLALDRQNEVVDGWTDAGST